MNEEIRNPLFSGRGESNRQPDTNEYWKFHTKPELGNWKNGADVATAALNRVLSQLPNPVHIDADGKVDMSLPFTEDADVLERDKLAGTQSNDNDLYGEQK